MAPFFAFPRLKIHPKDRPLATEPAREHLLQLLVDSALDSDLSQCVWHSDPSKLIRRYLPPGCYSDLYHLYTSYQVAANLPIASPTTFYRVLKSSGWRKVLKFRPFNTHSTCWVCHRLKAKLRHAQGVAEHAVTADKLMRHLAGQFQDRSVYWALRTRAKRNMDVLVAITDSMDKAKFALPRFTDAKVPKDLARLNRPVCELTTCIIHGRIIYTCICDENQTGGSNWVLEVVNRALSHAFSHAQQNGLSWPSVLKLFADNTPKDLSATGCNVTWAHAGIWDCCGFALPGVQKQLFWPVVRKHGHDWLL